ncbi:MAG: hypothetical protein K2H96_04520 [Muribaculaceae bacterium]|nr:hypothetical protein [Muribaculaceae bacterium]
MNKCYPVLHKLSLSIIIVIACYALFGVTGCSDARVGEVLRHADQLMETQPDSVRFLLDGIDTLKLNKANASLYAVLDAQSRHKLYMPPPASDSLLNTAVNHYSVTGPDSLLMKSLFYRAVECRENGDIESATHDAINSWELAGKMKDNYWQAKDAELVADLAEDIQNYQEELKWRKSAAESYKKAGKQINYLYTLCDVSSSYLNLRDSVNACCLDDSIGKLIQLHPDNEDLQLNHAYYSIFIQNTFGELDKADSLYNLLRNTYLGIGNRTSLQMVKANILLNQGNFEECRTILDSINEDPATNNSIEIKSLLFDTYFRLSKASGNFSLMSKSVDSLLYLQSNIINNALNQPVTATQRDYFQVEAATKEEQRHKATVIGWWILICAVILIATGIVIYRIHLKRKNKLLNEKVAQILDVSTQLKEEHSKNMEIQSELEALRNIQEGLQAVIASAEQKDNDDLALINKQKNELKKKSAQINQLTKKLYYAGNMLSNLYTEQWSTINMLCKEFFNKDKSDSAIIMANINNELEKLKSKGFYQTLEKDLNTYYDGIIKKLRAQCVNLKEEDLKLIILCLAGFSSIAISLLTECSTSTFYARKQRIISKISLSNVADRELFLSYLKK